MIKKCLGCGVVLQNNQINKEGYVDNIEKEICERCFKLIAELCKKYDIPITANTVMTHYEFGLKNPFTTSAGKIDIIYLPPYPWVTSKDIGCFIRAKIKWYKGRI